MIALRSGSTWKHNKSGKTYIVDRVAVHTETGKWLVTYIDEDGKLWARPFEMFMDGRFVEQNQ